MDMLCFVCCVLCAACHVLCCMVSAKHATCYVEWSVLCSVQRAMCCEVCYVLCPMLCYATLNGINRDQEDTYIHTYMYACMYACMYARMHACMHACIHNIVCSRRASYSDIPKHIARLQNSDTPKQQKMMQIMTHGSWHAAYHQEQQTKTYDIHYEIWFVVDGISNTK